MTSRRPAATIGRCPRACLHPVGKEIAEHREHTAHELATHEHARRDRWVSIAEAVLLSVVALMAAWSVGAGGCITAVRRRHVETPRAGAGYLAVHETEGALTLE